MTTPSFEQHPHAARSSWPNRDLVLYIVGTARWFHERMRILLVASRPHDASAIEATLLDEGHTVTTCTDGSGGPCRGLHDFDECPLEASVDVAVVARAIGADDERSLAEMGAVCAVRHRVGVIELDPHHPSDRSLYDMADEAERAQCELYESTVAAMIEPILPAGVGATANVARLDRDVRVSVLLSGYTDALQNAAIADRARAGVRRHDRFARVIDVTVVQSAC
jgi:hypothetical protein